MKKLFAGLVVLCLITALLCGCNGNVPASSSEGSPQAVDVADEETLNLELLNELGIKYSDLVAKYGEPTDVTNGGGGASYKFKESKAWYAFGYSDLELGDYKSEADVPLGADGDWIFEKAPLPKGEGQCSLIEGVEASFLFSGLNGNVACEDLAEQYGVVLKNKGENDMDGGHGCSFYKDGKLIYVETDENYIVKPDSKVLYIKAQKEG